MIYIGNKPTFKHEYTSIEAHILEFNQDIYGKQIDLFLEEKIRGDIQFDSKDELIVQIKKDIKRCYGS